MFDHAFDNESKWIEPDHYTNFHPSNLFDDFGNYPNRISVQHFSYFTRQDGTLWMIY